MTTSDDEESERYLRDQEIARFRRWALCRCGNAYEVDLREMPQYCEEHPQMPLRVLFNNRLLQG